MKKKQADKIQTKLVKYDYNDEDDVLSLHWGENGTEVSEEFDSRIGHEFVLDYDEKKRIVGIEIFDWNKGVKIKK